MMRAWQGIAAAGLVLGMTACAQVGNTWVDLSDQCSVAAAGTDWSAVPVKTITWTDDGLRPNIVMMHPNSPYVLRLIDERAPGGVGHPRFSAPAFFESVQLATVGGAEPDGRCLETIDVAGGTTDIQLITGPGDNSYDFAAFMPFDPVIGWRNLEPGLTPGSGVISVR